MSALKIFRPCVLLCFVLLFQACQSGEKEQAKVEEPEKDPVYTGARLVQVDSIMIDLIGAFKVYDYQPQTGLFLGGDIGQFMMIRGANIPSNEIGHVVFDRKGNILHQFNHANSGPEGHSAGAHDNAFLGPDDIGVMSKKALYRYGIDGTYKGKYTDINTLDVVGYSGQRMIQSTNGRHIAMGIPKGMEDAKLSWDSIYQIVKPLWFYDTDRFNEQSLNTEVGAKALLASHGYPDHPIYHPDSKISTSPFQPLMASNHNNNELYAVHPLIPVASVYDMTTGQKKGDLDLTPENFEVETEEGNVSGGVEGYGGLLWSNKGGRLANARYHEMKQLGEYTLYRYSPALPSSVINEMVSTPGMLGRKEDWPRIRKKHYRFYYQLFKDGEKVMPDFELPLLEPQLGQMEMRNERMTRGQIIGGNGLDEIYVFIPNDGDEERDYELIRVFKLELIEE